MPDSGQYDAIVLAGGRSSRMEGVDKLGLEIGGLTLIERACAAVAGAGRLVVVGPTGRVGVPPHALITQEDPPFAGPAAAIGAGAAALGPDPAPFVVVIAADIPRAAAALPLLLEARLDELDGAIGLSSDGHRQPLLAIYRTTSLAAALNASAPLTDLSVRRLIAGLDLHEIALPDDIVADIDTPADLQRATKEDDRG